MNNERHEYRKMSNDYKKPLTTMKYICEVSQKNLPLLYLSQLKGVKFTEHSFQSFSYTQHSFGPMQPLTNMELLAGITQCPILDLLLKQADGHFWSSSSQYHVVQIYGNGIFAIFIKLTKYFEVTQINKLYVSIQF